MVIETQWSQGQAYLLTPVIRACSALLTLSTYPAGDLEDNIWGGNFCGDGCTPFFHKCLPSLVPSLPPSQPYLPSGITNSYSNFTWLKVDFEAVLISFLQVHMPRRDCFTITGQQKTVFTSIECEWCQIVSCRVESHQRDLGIHS